MSIAEKATEIRQKVATAAESAGRDKSSVRIVAVTKYSDLATTREFIAAGCTDLAENRADKFLAKYQQLTLNEELPIRWHFIGNLQTRKVRELINDIDVFHALDSLKLAGEIEKRATDPIKCFLEVNVSGEASKHGFTPSDLAAGSSVLTVLSGLTKVEIIGLMTMAPIDADEAQLTEIFAQTHALQEDIASRHIPNIPCLELSMGMSRDYEIAIKQGATMVRIGSEFLK